MFTSRSGLLRGPNPLAQEGTPLTSCIDNDDRQQRSHRDE